MSRLIFILAVLSCSVLTFSCNNESGQQQKNTVAKDATTGKVENSSHLPYYQDANFTPHWLNPKSASLDTFHQIPSFSLQNQLGEAITEKTFNDKIYITDFFFTTCPGICLKMTSNMTMLQDSFRNDNDVMLLSHTVMPSVDSVPVLEAYADEKGIDASRWHLVTGSKEELYSLGRNAYFVEEDLGIDKSVDDFLHTENFVLVDKKKHIRGIYNGLNKASLAQLVKDVRQLKEEG